MTVVTRGARVWHTAGHVAAHVFFVWHYTRALGKHPETEELMHTVKAVDANAYPHPWDCEACDLQLPKVFVPAASLPDSDAAVTFLL